MFRSCNISKRLKKIKYPIDIDLGNCTKIECYPLHCNYFDTEPVKLKMVNTGSTVLIRGTWPADRPCLEHGPLKDKYIFSQLHFHWGKNPTAGGNHTVDGEKQAMEMHVVFFKKAYIYPEVAREKVDGLVIMIYVMKFQLFANHKLDDIVERLKDIKTAGSECDITPAPFSSFIPTFENDFLVYRADVKDNPVTWIVSRIPIGISEIQVKAFQSILNPNERMIENFEANCYPAVKKHVWYVNPSRSQFATLLRAP